MTSTETVPVPSRMLSIIMPQNMSLGGFGSSKVLKVEGIYLQHHLCESLTGLPLWGTQRPPNKPKWSSSLKVDSITKAFFPLPRVTWLMSLNPRANKPWKPLRNSEAVAVFCGIECQRSKLISVKCSNYTIFQLHTTRKHLILSHTSPGEEASHSFAAKAKVGNLYVIYRENSN